MRLIKVIRSQSDLAKLKVRILIDPHQLFREIEIKKKKGFYLINSVVATG